MPRRKSIKDYSIRLVHPILGEYYFNYVNVDYYSYSNNTTYMFTQQLKKVNKWKTVSVVEEHIANMVDVLKKRKGKIHISLGRTIPNFSKEILDNVELIRKQYYYPINVVVSKHHINAAKNNIEKLDNSLSIDAEVITNIIKNSLHLEKDFVKKIMKLKDDVNLYRKDAKYLETYSDVDVAYVDIVNSSYGFRYLKLKTLKESLFLKDEV